MSVDPRAGHPAEAANLTDIPRLITAYYTLIPDPAIAAQRVSFGTSGHRGSAFATAFNEPHILAITQAICTHRRDQGIDGPLFVGIDTHALSAPAFASALEVLVANGVTVRVDRDDGYTPTPVVSQAIVAYNHGRRTGLADGIVITPSHNPPEDGGFKYNPPSGGPADTVVTTAIERAANQLLEVHLAGVQRVPFLAAMGNPLVQRYDYIDAYVGALDQVIDFEALRRTPLRLGVDPLGGAGVRYWPAISARYGVPITVVSDVVDPTFRFMTLDWDGRIRMDCSSPYAMQRLIRLKDQFDVAWGCDTDHDRHGIVAHSSGLLDPNAYLAVAVAYLFGHRPAWSPDAGVGKTIVSSSMIDRATARWRRPLVEVPVGFKWFVDGLVNGSLAFVGEESAGATLLRRDGSVWTTDKDGLVLGLLAAEMTAVTGRDPGELYADLVREFGATAYQRIDAPATRAEKAVLAQLAPEQLGERTLADDPITAVLTVAPGNQARIGGIKVIAAQGWFAVRPSGTEDVYKLYAESFIGTDHLHRIQAEAQAMIRRVLSAHAGS